METKAKNLLVGLFVLATLLIGTLFAVWVTRLGEQGNRKTFFVVFQGSVQGLGQGSLVVYNGLRVGEVTEIGINPGNRSEIRARMSVNVLTPVKRDSRVRLSFAGLTGGATLEISGGSQPGEDLVPGTDGVPPAMFAERSFVQNLLDGGTDTLARVNSVVTRLEELVVANQANVQTTLDNVKNFTDALASNAPAINTFLADATITARRLADLSARLDQATASIEPRQVGEIVNNLAELSAVLAQQREGISSFVGDASRAARGVAEATQQLAPMIERADRLLSAVDVTRVQNAVRQVETFTEALGGSSGRVSQILEEAQGAVTSFRAAANRVEEMIGGGAGTGLVGEATETLKQFRQTAAVLERRINELSGDLSRVTGPAVRELQGLMAETRRTVGSLDRVVRDLERNPQQLLLGRPGVPEFNRGR
jgi:phospholipid/cholesterol/gamma-HCH transport system substrate-binding protein